MAVLLVGVTFYNSIQLNELKNLEVQASPISGAVTASSAAAQPQTQQVRLASVSPTGVPRIYGAELGVSYDDISASNPSRADAAIRKLGVLDQQITLTGGDLQRYIGIASQISCEYCCGAESIIFETGEAACGCAHSYAMRGVAKYLIKNHGSEFTDDEILEEMGKWKTLFFPGQLAAKAQVLKSSGIELNFVNLASNNYRGAETQAQAQSAGSGSGIVGGC